MNESLQQCPQCEGKGWYAKMNCSSLPHEAEQEQCKDCLGTGRIAQYTCKACGCPIDASTRGCGCNPHDA